MQAYLRELQTIRSQEDKKKKKSINTQDFDKLVADELYREFDLLQYDLNESDVLRAIKIESILSRYPDVFNQPYALKLFYAISKADIIRLQTIYDLINIPQEQCDEMIMAMIDQNLVDKQANEIELTHEGKSLAERIGIDIYII